MARIAGWRSRGDGIVFTNGCFDILHIGHISLLEEARRKGDRLIVGLNSDSWSGGLRAPRGLLWASASAHRCSQRSVR